MRTRLFHVCISVAFVLMFISNAKAQITGTFTLCAGDVISLSDSRGGGTWSSGATGVATVDGSGHVTGVSHGTAVISYNYSGGTDMATVSVSDVPTIAALMGDTAVCVGIPVTMSDATAGGVWLSSNTRVARISSSGVVTGVSPGYAGIIYAVSNECGMAIVDTTISVSTLSSISASSQLCQSSSLSNTSTSSAITITGLGTAGYWSSSNTGVANVSSTGRTVVGTSYYETGYISGVSPGTAIISFVHPSGCPATKTVTVSPIPTITGTGSECVGSSVTLTGTPSGGNWFGGSDGYYTYATVGASSGIVTGVTGGSAQIYYTSTLGCTVGAIETILPSNAISGGDHICGIGSTLTLSTSATAGVWTSSNPAVATIGSSSGVVTAVSIGVTTISYITSAGCGGASMALTVLNTASAIIGDSQVCVGNTITMSNTATGGTWSTTDATVATANPTTGVVTGVAGGYAVVVYQLDNSCYHTTLYKPIVVSSISAISGTGAICESASPTNHTTDYSIVLTGSPFGGTWISSNTAVVTISSVSRGVLGGGFLETGRVNGVAAGTAIITFSHPAGCQVTKTITINPTPAAISGSDSVCQGSSITLTDATGGGNFSVVSGSNMSITSGGVLTGIVTDQSIHSGTVRYTTSNGCSIDKVKYVNPVGVITGTTTRCTGTSATLSTGVSGGTWTSGNTAVATIGASSGTWTAISSGTARITYTTPSGCTSTTTVTVLNHAGITGRTPICMGDTTQLVDTSHSGGDWSSGDPSIITVDASGLVNAVSAGSASIIYLVTNACGTYITTQRIVVQRLFPILGYNTVCQGLTTTLTESFTGGSWISSNTGVATVTGGIVTGITAGTAIISYSYSVCPNPVVDTVTVYPLPAGITGAAGTCAGATTTLSDITPGGAWSSANTAIATVGSGTGVVHGTNPGITLITYTLPTSCIATRSVTIDSALSAGTISGATSLCVGTTISLSDGIAGGVWHSGNPLLATIDTATGVVTGVAGGVDTISYTRTNACGTATSTYTITIIGAPNPGTITGRTTSGRDTVCMGDYLLLSESVAGGVWSTGDHSMSIYYPGSTPGTVVVAYTVTNSCTSRTATDTIYTNPSPDAGTISGAPSVCVGASVTLSDGVSGGVWGSSSANVTVGTATGVVSGVTAGTASIYYAVTNYCGNDTSRYTIVINPLADVGTISGAASICAGAATTLTETVSGTWISGNTAVATIDPFTGDVNGVSAGTAIISYAVTNVCGTLYATRPLTILPLPAAIGGSSVCLGGTTTLTDASAGGTWSSSDVATGSISSGGVIAGISIGTTTVTYTLPTGCLITKIISVNPLPGGITGATTVCVGSTSVLSDATFGGSWSSGNMAIATIGAGSGILTGVAAGTATVSYTLSTGCYATTAVLVNPLPSAISGAIYLCLGATSSLSSTPGGTWQSNDESIATIDGGTGALATVSTGVSTITYTLGTGCYTTANVTVNALPADITGGTDVCTGLTTTLSDGTSGGRWSRGNSNVTVGSTTGIVTGVTAGTSIVSYTLSTGCYSTMMVTIYQSPAAITSASSAVCYESSLVYHESVSGGTWSSSNTSVATVDGSGNITGTNSGTMPASANITYTMPGSCIAVRSVTVNPRALIVGSRYGCTGSAGAITLFDAVDGGTWSSSNTAVASIGSASGGTANLTGGSTGTAIITYTTAAGCSDTALVHIVVTPSAAPISGPLSVCVGDSVHFSNANVGGTWSSGNPGTARIDTFSGTATGVSAGPVTIIYLYNNGCGTGALSTTTINVNPLPNAGAITGTTTVCVGQTSALSVSGGDAGGVWTSASPSIAAIGSSTGIVTGVSGGTATITYRSTNTCGTAYVTEVITVNPLPTAITGAGAVCVGSAITLSDATGTGTWTSNNTAIASIGSSSGTVTGISSGNVSITYQLSTGCYVTTTLQVNPLPAAISGTTTICAGQNTILSDATGGGTWSSANTSVATVTGGTVAGITAGTTTISYTLSTGCFTTASVLVNPLPAAITGTATVCAGFTTLLSDATGGGTWSTSDATVAIVGGGTVISVAAGTATITYALSTGCYATRQVTVNPVPASITGTTAVCVGLTTILSDATGSGTWSSSNTSTATVSGGTVTGVAAGTATITYALATGCMATAVVVVNPLPAAITGTTMVCEGLTTALSDATGGGTWSTSNSAVATVTGGTVTGVAVGTATITYTLSTGCLTTTSVLVNPVPASITGTTVVCAGLSTTLSDATGGGTWSSGNTSVATVSGGTVTGVAAGTATITYTLSTGCIATTVVLVNPLPGSITGTTSVCVGLVTTLGDATGGGTWTSSNTGVATVTGGSVTGVSAGTAAITYTLSTGCMATTAVVVNPLPAAITGATTVCAGLTSALSDATGGGTWTSSNNAVATATGGTLTGIAAGTATITYTLSTGCIATTSVLVNPVPAAITGTTSVCAGLGTTLSDVTGGGTWSSSNTSVATVSGGAVSAVSAGTSIISYTLSTGCMATAMVVVNPLPAAITGTTTVCAGFSTILSDATGGGTWSTSDAAVATASGATITGTGAGTATVTYTLSTGCIATTSVFVNPAPASITGTASVCVGLTTALSDATGGGTWSSSNSGTASVSGGTVTGVSAGTAIITYTLSTGCYTTKVVLVNPLPAAITGTTTVCAGLSTILNDATGGGTWSTSNSGVATVSGGTVTGVAAGTAAITYTLGTGCITTVNILVNPVPSAITGTAYVCAGSSTTLSDADGGGTWSTSNSGVATVTGGVVNGISAGSATITYAFSTGCIATKVVTVNPLPAAITGTMSVCVGRTTALSDVTGGGTWSSSDGSVASASGGTITGVAAGTAIITYTLPTGCITTAVVTVNPLPTAITGTTTVCAGLTTALSDATGGGTWSTSNSGVATVSGGTVTGVAGGTATITYTLSTGCIATAQVLVNPVPAAITGTMSVCVGLNTTLSDATGGGTWSSSDISVATTSGGTITGVATGTAIITYTLSTGCIATALVVVNPLPAAITGATTVCAGLTTALSDATGGGTWSTSNSAVATVSGGTVTGIAGGTAIITYTLSTGCIATTSVLVNPVPAVITGTMSVCAGLTTTLSDATGGGTWGSSNTAVATTSGGTITGVAAGTAIITYTLSTGCIATALVVVNPLPAAITGTTTVCAGLTTALSDATGGGTWSTSNSGVATVSGGTVTGIAGGTATITYTLSTGCIATASVLVNPVPATITGTMSVCAGLTTFLSDATGGGTWSSSNTSVADVTGGTVTGVTAGTAIITYALSTGCIATAVVVVNPLPAAITGATTVCVGLTSALSDATGGGTWSSSNNSVATATGGTLTGVGAGTATVTYTLSTGCIATASVLVNPIPVAISGTRSVCAGLTTILDDATGGGTWSTSNSAVATVSGGTVTGVSAGTVVITYAISTGCIATAVVTVNPLPAAITGTTTVCAGLSTILSDATGGGTWSTSNSAVATVSGGTVTGVAAGTATITYTLATGCITTANVLVNPVPSAITGIAYVCAGSSTTLSDADGGGTWSTSNSGVATVTGGVVSGISAGSATITYAFSTGCIATKVVTVNPLPAAITGTMSVCVGRTTALSDATGGGTWSSSDGSVATTSGGTITGVAAGTAIITYTLPTGCITTAVVTVNPLPAAITGTTTVCAGLTTVLSDATGGGTWSTSNSGVATVSGGTVTGVAGGTATITYTLSTGCIATAQVLVNPVPAAIAGTMSVCVGLTTSLSDATGGGTWSSSDISVATTSGGTITGVAAGTAIITYTLSTGCIATALVVVNPLPAAITGTTTVCAGLTTALSDATGGGTWSTSNSAVATVSGGTVTGIAGGTATITYTLSTGCIATTSVLVNPVPAAITGTMSVCAGLTTVLSDATGSGTWSSSNTAVADVTGGTVTGVSAGTAIITYSLATGCIATAVVVVNPLPAAITGTTAVCAGLTTSLSDASAGGTWSSSNGAVATATGGTLTGIAAGTATVTYTLSTGCIATTSVLVNPVPAAITGTTTVCLGLTTTLSDATGGGTWSTSNTSVATVTGGIVTGGAAGTAIITYALSTGCSDTAVVIVNPLPASISGLTTVCAGLSTTLTDATGGGTWSSSNTAVATVTGGTLTGVAAGTAMVTYTLSTGCIATASVLVNPLPAAITGTTNVCQGLSTTLSDATGGGLWSSGNSTVASVSGGVVTGVAAGTTTITYTLFTGCIATAAVTVNPLPAAIAGATTVCAGLTSILSDATGGGTWSTSNSAVATVSGGTITAVSAGTATITYTLSTGCIATTSVLVNPLPAAIAGTTTVCAGLTTNLSDATGGGTWSTSNSGVATVSGGTVTGVSAGTAIITYALSTGCIATAAVLVNPVPAAITGTTTMCAGVTVTLADATSGGTWSSSNTSVATISGGTLTSISAGTSIITYALSTGCIATTVVVVNPLPSAITGLMSFSVGSSNTWTDASAGGHWISTNTAIATVGSSSGLVTGVSAGTTIITYLLPTGCLTTGTVTINALPDPIGGTLSVCATFTTTLTEGSTGGTWSSSNTAVATIGSLTGTVTGLLAGTTMITYTLPTTAYITAVFRVNPLPAASAITGTDNVCMFTTSTFTDSVSGGIWSSSDMSVAVVGSSSGVVIPVSLGTAIITYTVSNVCGSAMATRAISVMSLRDPGVITGPSSVCVGGTMTLSNSDTGSTITWSASNANASVYSGLITGLAPGLDTIIFTVSNECGTSATIKTLTIVPIPGTAPITGPSSVCVSASITLADATGGGTWSSSGGVTVGSTTGIVTGVSAGTTIITYSVTNICGSAVITKVITVNQLPDTGLITGATSVCAGSLIALSDASSGGVWTSSSTGNATVGSSTGFVTGVSAGTAIVSYTVNNMCGTLSATSVITINPVPVAGSISGATTVCTGLSTTLIDTTSGGVWSTTAPSVATVGSSTGNVTGVAPGTAIISYTVTNGCGSIAATQVVTVGPLPNAGTISGAGSVCVASTIVLTDGTAGGAWSSSTGNASVTSGSVTGITAGTAVISYTVTNGCVSATSTKTLVVNPLPNAGSISGASSVCTGATITLTDVATGGVWSRGNSNITVGSSTGVVTGVSAGTAAVSYTVTNSCGTDVTSTVLVINPVLSAGTISGATFVSIGGTTNLTETATGGTWSASNSNASVSSLGVVTGAVSGLDTIMYTVSNVCGTAVATKTINVNSVSPIDGTTTVCPGSTTTLSDVDGGGIWSSSNTAIATVGSSTGIVSGIATGTATITYSILGNYVTTTVTVPLISAISSGATVCQGQSITLTDPIPGGTWSSAAPTIATVGSSTGVVTGVGGGLATTITYTISGCRATTTVSVIPFAAIGGSSSVCQAQTTTLTDATTGGTWTTSDATISIDASSGVVTGISAGTAIVTYSVATGCTTTAPLVVNPTAPISGPTSVCVGQTMTLVDAISGGTWSTAAPTIATVGSSSGVVTGVAGGLSVNISYTLPTGCAVGYTVTVNALSAITGPSTVCQGQTATLSNATSGGTWSSGDATVSVNSTSGVVTGVSFGTAIITYISPAGCIATAGITVNTATAISGPSTVCQGQTITLTDGTGGGTWSSSGITFATIGSSSGVVSGLAPGAVTISYTLGTGCSVSVGVTVNALSAITGSSSVCVGQSTTLSNSTSGGTWSTGDATASVNSTTGVVTGVSGGTATISYTTAAGCIATSVITINAAGTITGPSSVCQGQTITLSNGTGSGTWTSATPTMATVNSSTGVVTGIAIGSVNISYTLSTGCATGYTVTVNALSAISGPTSVCQSQTITLTDATLGGTWSTPCSTASVGSTTGIVTGINSGTATISYTTAGGCVAKAIIAINATAPITGSSVVCVGQTITLSNSISGGTWSSGSPTIATIGTTGVVTGVAGGLTANISYTLASGCRSVLTVTVNALPAITGASGVCIGQAITLSDATAGGSWSSTALALNVNSATGVVTGLSSGSGTITYMIGPGCVISKVVSVLSLPAAITGTTSICAGASTMLSDATGGGTWSSGNTAVATIGSTSGSVIGVSAGTAAITYTASTGCVAGTVMTINQSPSVITGPTSVCITQTTTVLDSVSGGAWTSSATGVATIDATTGLVTGVANGTTILTYTIGSCTKTAVFAVVTSVPAITGTLTACVGGTRTLSNPSTGGTWNSTNTAIATINSSTGVVTGVSAGTVVISYTIPCGTTTSVVTVYAPPTAISGASTICNGSTTTFTDAVTGGTWSSSNTGSVTIGSSSGVATGVSPGTSVITYTAPTGCYATTVLTISSSPITGSTIVCAGTTTVLSSSVPGGLWASSNTSVATINCNLGILSAVSVGTTIITYTFGTGCTSAVTVNVINLGANTGTPGVCVGATTALSNATAGGTWSSSDITVATVGTTGIVTGVAAGNTTISYTFGTGCTANTGVSVLNLSANTGSTAVCVGQTTALSNVTVGGTWSSSSTANATVVSGTGVVTGVAAGTAIITYNFGSNCAMTTPVTINALPTVVTVSGGGTFCGSTTITASNSDGSTIYFQGTTSGGTSTATASSSQLITTSGTYYFRSQSAAGCWGAEGSATVSINVINGASTVCTGTTSTLTNSGGSATWSSSNTAVATAGASTGVITGVSSGTAIITSILGSGCIVTTTAIVSPSAPAISGPSSVCVGQNITLTNTAVNGTWSSGTPTIATIGATTGIVNGLASGAGVATITYTLGSTGCRATATVSVNALAVITGSSSVCAGQQITLADGASGGTWSSTATGVATIGSTGIVTGVAAGTTTISYIMPTGCSTSTGVSVIVMTPVTGPASVCIGQTITLSDATGGGTWSSSSPTIATVGSANGVVTGVAGNLNTTITYTLGSGCRATAVVSVNPLSTISSPGSVCQGSAITLTDGTSGGSWISSDGSIATIGSTSGSLSGVGSGIVTISYVMPTGCTSTTQVFVNPYAAISGPNTVCQGQTMTLTNSAGAGTWSSSAPTVATVGTSSGIVTGIAANLTANITYTFCTGCRATKTITVNPLSAISGASSVCQTQTTTMTDGTTGGTWSTSSTGIATIGSTSGIALGTGAGVVTISYSLATGCTATATMSVNALGAITGTTGVCVGKTTTLSDAAPGGTWTSGSPTIATIGSTGIVTGVAGGLTANISYTLASGCRAITVVTVNANPAAWDPLESTCRHASLSIL